jgi:hypothetical protein
MFEMLSLAIQIVHLLRVLFSATYIQTKHSLIQRISCNSWTYKILGRIFLFINIAAIVLLISFYTTRVWSLI